ncbi:MAG: hypothetical protein L6420_01935 [Elusimicrobia bacterium]|nr:hypothetical protein [Candidatus Omnitrophota bacterium]MCG2725012.1 hypothetical protein [Elusimicrobiota bacterium]
MQKNILEKIVAFGVAAPSGDNCQSWEIERHVDILRLISVPAKDLKYLKIGELAAFLSFGALLENMDIASGSLGYAMQTNLFPDSKNPLLIAECSFKETPAKNDPLFSAIMERRTNRRPYAQQPLSPAARSNILEQASLITGPELHLFERTTPEFQKLARLTGIGEQMFFESEALHEYLFNHIRWDDFSARQTKDGMHVKTLELGNALMDAAFRFLKPWALASFLNTLGASWFINRRAVWLNQKSSAFILLNVPQSSPKDYVAAGRLMQRIWLATTACGLAMQPTSAISLALHAFKLGQGSFSPRHRRFLKQAEPLMDGILPAGKAELSLMMFRVGNATPPSGPSWRRVYRFE